MMMMRLLMTIVMSKKMKTVEKLLETMTVKWMMTIKTIV